MPHQTITDIRLNDILTCLKLAVTLLNELHHTFGTPFVLAISKTTLTLISAVQVRFVFLQIVGDLTGAEERQEE